MRQAALYLAAPLKAYGILASLAVVPGETLLITNADCDTGRLIIQMANLFGVKVPPRNKPLRHQGVASQPRVAVVLPLNFFFVEVAPHCHLAATQLRLKAITI